MKIALCVHGYPPELVGGTESSAQQLARGLVREGHEVLVIAGSCEVAGQAELRTSEARDEGVHVVRLHRPDLYFDHWHKSRSVRVNTAVRELLREHRPDVVHVLHWLRLTRELSLCAAREAIPSVVSLNDSWISCPLVLRVDPRTRASCERPLAAMGCISCASHVPPRTPWVPMEAAFLEFAQREAGVARELRLARVVLAPTQAHAQRMASLCDALDEARVRVVAPAAAPELDVPAQVEPAPPLKVLYFGALSELKGVDLLVEAAADPRLAGKLELRLAGREEHAGWLAELTARYPAARVVHLGAYDIEDLTKPDSVLLEAARTSHIFSSATRAPESFGLVLDEARALGLPLVLPEIGAFIERAQPNSGALLFEPGRAQALAEVWQGLLEDPESLGSLRAGLAPATRTSDVLNAHLAAYEEALRAEPPSPEDVGKDEWYADRMALFAEEQWDQSLSETDARELGFDA